MAAGIGMVHQHFMLIPVFTVTENVMLGHEDTRSGGFLDRRRARREVAEISQRYGLAVPPDALVADLPVGVQQRVEILKALSRDAKLLVLDEPTAVLTPQETDELITVMRALREAGTSIVFISHKLHEVREVADTITVIRRGAVVGSAEPSTPSNELASLMVGRPVQLTVDKQPMTPGRRRARRARAVVSSAATASCTSTTSRCPVRGGEIFAVAGVQGNGQTEFTQALVGLTTPTSGSIEIAGTPIAALSTDEILDLGVGYVPEDRLARRAGRLVHRRREPHPRPVRQGSVRQSRFARPGSGGRERDRACRRVRRAPPDAVSRRGDAVGRQSAEGGAGP